jgi:hypothetical protein
MIRVALAEHEHSCRGRLGCRGARFALALVAALLAGPAAASDALTEQRLAQVLEDHNAAWERGLHVWYQLYKSYGARWRVAQSIKTACDEDPPDDFLLSREQEDHQIVRLLAEMFPDPEGAGHGPDMMFRVIGIVRGLKFGYEAGWQDALTYPIRRDGQHAVCQSARDLADELGAAAKEPSQ